MTPIRPVHRYLAKTIERPSQLGIFLFQPTHMNSKTRKYYMQDGIQGRGSGGMGVECERTGN